MKLASPCDGATTGTPAYMAPEVSLGNAIDGRTDLYALGCVAYWLLTGRLVFEEKGATATMVAHVRKDPVPPSQFSELPVPEWLDRAILMCLAKEPAERPASAETLAQMLEAGSDPVSWTVKNRRKLVADQSARECRRRKPVGSGTATGILHRYDPLAPPKTMEPLGRGRGYSGRH